jgi:dienelactone hydrolase
LLIVAGLSSGCATLRFQQSKSRPPSEFPEEVLERYAYPESEFKLVPQRELDRDETTDPEWAVPFKYTLRAVSQGDAYILNEVEVLAGGTTVRFDYYLVKSAEPRPAVLVFPIFGGSYSFAKMFANHFARNGLSCVLMYRKEALTEAETFAELEPPLRQIVVDSKIAVDWLCERAEIDPTRLGAFGISMGGIKSAVVKCLEPRIGPAVVALAGGGLADILASSGEPKILERREALMREEQVDVAEFRERAESAILTDPLKLAPYADPSEIKMFVTLFDRTVPTRLQLRLWRGLGRPELSILPFGHYTAVLALPYARWQSLRFFEKKFGLRRAEPD